MLDVRFRDIIDDILFDTGMSESVRYILGLYHILPHRIKIAGGTAGHTWRVESDSGTYFVRVRGLRTASIPRAHFDHGLRQHLHDKGFCAFPPIENTQGDRFVIHEGKTYEVYPWINGQDYGHDLIEKVRTPVAQTLARFHDIAATYEADCERLVPQFAHFPVPIEFRPRLDDPAAFLDVIDWMLNEHGDAHTLAAMQRTREYVAWLHDAYSHLYAQLPRAVIHGDYNCFNLLFEPDGGVAGVFDFDWAWRDVRLRDVAELVFFFGTAREAMLDNRSIWSLTACPRFELKSMTNIVKDYHDAAPLTAEEQQALPLAILARWVSCRTEGLIKVEQDRRSEFLLHDFDEPFRWYDEQADSFVQALADVLGTRDPRSMQP